MNWTGNRKSIADHMGGLFWVLFSLSHSLSTMKHGKERPPLLVKYLGSIPFVYKLGKNCISALILIFILELYYRLSVMVRLGVRRRPVKSKAFIRSVFVNRVQNGRGTKNRVQRIVVKQAWVTTGNQMNGGTGREIQSHSGYPSRSQNQKSINTKEQAESKSNEKH